jgi:hypothetical protein
VVIVSKKPPGVDQKLFSLEGDCSLEWPMYHSIDRRGIRRATLLKSVFARDLCGPSSGDERAVVGGSTEDTRLTLAQADAKPRAIISKAENVGLVGEDE